MLKLKAALLLSTLVISGCGNGVVKQVSEPCDLKLIGYKKTSKYGYAKFLLSENKTVSIRMGKHKVPNETYGKVFNGTCGQKTYENGDIKNTYSVSFKTKTKVGSSSYMLPGSK